MIAYADKNIAAQGGDMVLARTIWAEARAETEAGQTAVARCIRHRAEIAAWFKRKSGEPHVLFGDGSIADACLSSFRGIHQFSCWNDTDPNRLKALQANHDDPAFCKALQIARDVIAEKNDPMPGYTHYFNPQVVREPSWAKGLPYVTIGHHRFFRNVP